MSKTDKLLQAFENQASSIDQDKMAASRALENSTAKNGGLGSSMDMDMIKKEDLIEANITPLHIAFMKNNT